MVFPPELLELPPLLDEEPPEEEEELDEDIPLLEPLELLPLLPEPELPFIPDELPELAIPLDDPLAPDDPEEEEALLSPPPAFPTEPQERREQRAMSENDFIWIWSFVFWVFGHRQRLHNKRTPATRAMRMFRPCGRTLLRNSQRDEMHAPIARVIRSANRASCFRRGNSIRRDTVRSQILRNHICSRLR